jgi:hypothetical protein
VSRLFISHSSRDNIAAFAFKQWLGTIGWQDEDVFLDLDSIGAGERWKEALNKANTRCEGVILLASPDALSSPECVAEVRKAEDDGKEIIVVLLHDVQFDDRRLDSYKDRQIVDLAAPPQTHVEAVDYRGEKNQVHFNPAGLARIKDFLAKRGITPDRFALPPQDRPDAQPFPGLSAFTEDDAGIFLAVTPILFAAWTGCASCGAMAARDFWSSRPPLAPVNHPICARGCGRGSIVISILRRSVSCVRPGAGVAHP